MLDQRSVVAMLKAAAEPTRLRLLVLLAMSELNVKDLTRILGQSQPRISRHLKLMAEAGLINRLPDGSWAYFQIVDRGPRGALIRGLLTAIDVTDQAFVRDRTRALAVKLEREASAQDYFRTHAAEWDRIRTLHVTESEVEAALRDALGPGPFRLLVDLGTGTGRVLELVADRYQRGLGFDINHSMLTYARGKLDEQGLTRASLRHGDLYDVALADACADAVVMHQVLHFLAEPQQAIREAARLLAPGGQIVIVDFAPHKMEFLREDFAHDRLGFAAGQIADWLREAGLVDVTSRNLAPAGADADGKLTVTVWTAHRPDPGDDQGRSEQRHKVEA